MTDITFGIIILALLGGFSWYVYKQEQKEAKLINAILSKDSQEYVSRTLAENTKIKPEINGAEEEPDLMSMDQLTDEGFDSHIQAMLNNKVADQEVI